MSYNEIVLACDMTAIPAEQREQHERTAEQLFGAVQALHALPMGYKFQLAPAQLALAAAFIENERRCCSFFEFSLTLEPNSTALWLSLSASVDVKPLLKEELGRLLPATIAAELA